MATDNTNSGNQSTNPLAGSPWDRLTEVTSLENVTQGFASATGNTSGSAPMTGGSGSTTNPFSNFGNPNAEGSPLTGGVNPWAAINTSGSGSVATSTTSTAEVSTNSLSGTTSTGGSTDVITGAPSTGTSTSGGGSFGGSTSGGGNFGGIDFGSASQTQSFQARVQTDELVSSSLADAGISLPGSGSSFDGSGSTAVGGGSQGGNQGGFGGGSQGGNQGGFGGGSQGGFGGGQSGEGSTSGQISPFSQLRMNLDTYFASGEYQSGSTANLNPFAGGGMPSSGGSESGSGSQGAGGSNQSGSPFSSNASANQIDATRFGLTDSITAQVNSGNPNTDAIAGEISTSVDNLVTSLTNTSGGTSSPADASSVSTPSTTATESVFPQSVTGSTETQGQITTTTANDGGLTAANDFVTALSGNASQTEISNFANLVREYVGSSNANADDLTVVGNFLNDVSAGNNSSGGSQVGSVFTQTSGSLTDVQSNINSFTEILNQYSGLGSQGTQSSSDVAQLLQDITNFSNTINQFQSGSGNPFASGDNSSNAIA